MNSGQSPLAGRVAIVTGASRGIGAAIAERLGSAGATVIAGARTVRDDSGRGSAEETAARIRERGGQAIALPLDMELPETHERLVADTIELFGRIDILVNNAGTATYLPTDEMPLATARAQTDTYFLGLWHMCHLVLPQMKRQGEGRILTIGSCAVLPPEPPFDAYNAARGHETLYAALKAAAHRLSQGLAAEVQADGIAVNVLAPVGAVLTPGLAALDLGITPDMPICEPAEDMAEAALDMLCQPLGYTAQVEYSYHYLDRIGRSSMSLDGRDVVRRRRSE